MPLLKEGSSGAAVTKLQTQLEELGFKLGRIDGKFGKKTHDAVVAFQKSRSLESDGIVGPNTLAALKENPKPKAAPTKSEMLKEGSSGASVSKLQQRLNELGFNAGKVDGKFGPGTRAAVIAFQKSQQLNVDGIVGPNTDEALKNATPVGGVQPKPIEQPPLKDSLAATIARKMFPGVPVANLNENLPFVMDALSAAGLDDRDMVLMALATIRAETGNFTPLSEFKSKFNTTPNGHPFNRYDDRADLGNRGRPDGERFRGRGYIQLTGRSNYSIHGAAIGLGTQLVENPLLANQPDIAARLLASFLKSKESAIRAALAIGDLKKARKLVNGGSHGLAEFKQAFNAGKNVSG